jgi:hypothetical protein
MKGFADWCLTEELVNERGSLICERQEMWTRERCGLVNEDQHNVWTRPVQITINRGSEEPALSVTLQHTFTVSTVLMLQTLILNTIFMPEKKIFIWQYL